MDTKATQFKKGILALFLSFTCFATLAQTNTTEKKQDECSELKTWYDAGDNIVETVYEEQNTTWVDNGNGGGYVCAKAKINRVLKGNLVVGSYINVNINSPQKTAVFVPESGMKNDGILTTRAIVKIQVSNLKEVYTTENKGVYTTVGKIYRLQDIGNDNHTREVNGKKETFNSTQEFYKKLNKCCGVSLVEKKSPINSSQSVNDTNKINIVAGCAELFISEYLDGQSNNNAVEIYNPTSSSISLSNYKLLIYHNASQNPATIALTGTISAFGTHVIAEQGANSSILSHANQTTSSLNFNGNVVTVLNKGSVHIDIIGEIGVTNSAGNWTLTPTGGTNNSDIRRKYNITAGDTNWTNCKAEWDVFSEDSIHNFGQHKNLCSTLPDPDIYYTIANSVLSNGYLDFDVKASTDGSNDYLVLAPLHFQYDTMVFGRNVVANGNIVVTNGSSFPFPNYQAPNQSNDLNDKAQNEFAANLYADLSQATTLTILPSPGADVTIMHIRMKVKNCYLPQTVKFIGLDSVKGSSYYYNSSSFNYQTDNPFMWDNIFLGGNGITDSTVTNPCQPVVYDFYLSNNGAVGGEADSPINPNSASKLGLTGVHFGTVKGFIYMTAADDNYPHHSLIKLDPYDIAVWNDSVVIVNVPSDLFVSNPSFGKLPGSGTMWLKPFFGSDSVFSPYDATISYAVTNGIGTNFKIRLGFTYRNIIDSSGRQDSTAYKFRLDPLTVGTVNPYCRELTKTAIKDWACAIGIRYRIGTDTNIVNGYNLQDGFSYVSFNNNMSNPNFVAQTRIYPVGCGSNYYSAEADVSFLQTISPSWYFVRPDSANLGTNCINGTDDYFSEALHELGHVSLLKHVNDVNDVMYYARFEGAVRSGLNTTNIHAGLDNVAYAKTKTYSGSCAYSPITIPANGSSACLSPTSGIKENIGENIFELSVYPNPSSQLLNVTFIKEKESSNTVKLVNLIGQTVYYTKIAKNEGANEVINISDLAKGVYMLIVTDNNNTVTKKIIVE
jgi:hypothetical protein